MNRTLLEVAASQEGLLSITQLRELGLSESQRARLVTAGRLRRAAPGVYAIPGCPDTHRYRLRLGLLCIGGEAAVGFEAAAALHQLDRSDPTAVEFIVPRDHRRGKAHFTVHRTDSLGPHDVHNVEGFRCTSATRTILDLALAGTAPMRLEAAIDSAMRTGLSSPIVLTKRLAELRGPGRWGVRTLDRLLVDSGGHSPLERRFLALVRAAGLPRPSLQTVFRARGRFIARVDFFFEASRVVVEVSGGRGHSTPANRAKDAQRRNELQDLGLRVYEFTWEHVTERPAWVVEQLKSFLRDTP